MIKSLIPNFLTLLNLVCGCFSIAFAFQFQFDAVLILVLFGVFLDYLDGLTARLLNAESNFGKQLDSLSDIITSGVVPGIVVYQLFKLSGNKVIDFDLNPYSGLQKVNFNNNINVRFNSSISKGKIFSFLELDPIIFKNGVYLSLIHISEPTRPY